MRIQVCNKNTNAIKVFVVVCFLSLFFSCGNKFNVSKEANQKSWKFVSSADDSKPIARHEAAFVKVEDKFYLLGGRGIRNVSIFDTKNRTWTKGSKPPIEIHHFQPIVYQGNIYIIGALTGKYPSETPVENIYIYNVKENLWIKGAKIPKDRQRGSTGTIVKNGIVYIACGISNGHISGHKKWFDSYNIKTGEWKILPNAPRARDHFQAVEHQNKIYLLAGRLSKAPNATFSETIGEIDVFDLKENQWKTLKNNIPTQRAGNMAIYYQGNILVIGGESLQQDTAHSNVEGLNIKTQKWRKYPSLKQGRHGSGAILFKNHIYIASGCGNRGGSPELNSMENY